MLWPAPARLSKVLPTCFDALRRLLISQGCHRARQRFGAVDEEMELVKLKVDDRSVLVDTGNQLVRLVDV